MSSFELWIDTDRKSMTDPYDTGTSGHPQEMENRRKQVASLLRCVAAMLEQGRNVEKIRDFNGNVVGHYTLNP